MTPSVKVANMTLEWIESLRRWHLEYFSIPTTLITLATLLANPVLLTCICLSRALRQETRYLLVANTLTADMFFLILNLAVVIFNAVTAEMNWIVCQLLTAVTVTVYSCSILTVTLMVADTYAAVRWPLHYRDLFPPARIRRILAGVWVLAAMYPVSLLIVMEMKREVPHGKVAMCLVLISMGFIEANVFGIHIYFFVAATICAVLILYCYVRLYMVTKTQGIWQNRFSRARVTLLAHGALLLLYFAPGFLFTTELFLFQKDNIDQDVRVWICTLNMSVFTLLPRAFAPYLYGIRYREISDTLQQLLHRHRRLGRVTVS